MNTILQASCLAFLANTLYHFRKQIDRINIRIVFVSQHESLAPRATSDIRDTYFPIEVGYQTGSESCLPITTRSLSVYTSEEIGYQGEVEIVNHYIFLFVIFHCSTL